MFRYLRSCSAFTLVLVISAFLTERAAWADIIYTVITTGTIISGTSYGTFGASGTNLAGQIFSATQTFDATQAAVDYIDATQQYLTSVTSQATITVNNNNYRIKSQSFDPNSFYELYDTLPGLPGTTFNSDIIYAKTYSDTPNNVAQYVSDIQSYYVSYLSSADISQTFYYALPATGFAENAFLLAPDGSIFTGTISTVALNGGTATPIPEPASAALFSVGLIGLGWLRTAQRRMA
jgi:hypothetical protein